MTNTEDPSRLLRDAWSVVRLTAIREFVGETICRLGKITPEDLLGRAHVSVPPMDPIERALQTCSDELRSGSGLSSVGGYPTSRTRAVEELAGSHPEWSVVYEEALVKYRAEAGRALRSWLESLDTPAASTCSH